MSKNLSVFSNKLGTQIASKVVSAVDDGTIANSWGSNNIDDEGNKTQKVVLIEIAKSRDLREDTRRALARKLFEEEQDDI